MKIKRVPYTEKYPWLYMLEVGKVTVTTTVLDKFSELLAQVIEKDITEFDNKQIQKLHRACFSVFIGYPTIWKE